MALAKIVFLLLLDSTIASHFLGGNIRWKYEEKDKKVHVCYTLSWRDKGRACDIITQGNGTKGSWKCTWGCGLTHTLSTPPTCSGYSTQAGWVQEMGCLTQFLNFQPVLRIKYEEGSPGMASNKPARNSLEAEIDIQPRSDTGLPNNSPISAFMPIYTLAMGCEHDIWIPTKDPDGDDVECDWPTACSGQCRTLPNATLEKNPCILHISATAATGYISGSSYVVTLTLKDYRKSKARPRTALGKTTVQFVVSIISQPEPCWFKPRFQFPTPSDGALLRTVVGKLLVIPLALFGNNSVAELSISAPSGVRKGRPPQASIPMTTTSLSWIPTSQQTGHHVICTVAVDLKGLSSDQRCFFVEVKGSNFCETAPCRNGGRCLESGDGYTCECSSTDFFGLNCEFSSSQQQCIGDDEESHCVCDVNGMPIKVPLNLAAPELDGPSLNDVISGSVGMLTGFLIGAAGIALWRKCRDAKKRNLFKTSTFGRPASSIAASLMAPSSARSPVTMATLSPRQITPDVLSVTSSHDPFQHSLVTGSGPRKPRQW